MQRLVVSLIGDDRTGLVDVLSGAIADHGGNWERSEMAELEGKFAGVVVVSVAEEKVEDLTDALQQIEREGLLHLTVENGAGPSSGDANGAGDDDDTLRLVLELVGQDHPGIVHEISSALAEAGASVEEFSSEIVRAPMGGNLFQAKAVISAPSSMPVDDLQDALEAIAHDLMVDLAFSAD